MAWSPVPAELAGAVELDESYFGPRQVRGKIDAVAMVNTDGWRDYDGLVDVGFDRHFRVRHGQDEFVHGASHINGIESF